MAAKKRKNDSSSGTRYGINETFDNSEDEFIAGRDQILLEDGPEAKRRRKLQEEEADLQPSDEEVLGYDDEEEEDEDDEYENDYTSRKRKGGSDSGSDIGVNDEEEEEEEGLEAWGSSRKDYYNADTIETEADALEEENEAKRLQQKHLKAMKEADFGFDEIGWLESGQGAEDGKDGNDGVVTEVLPQLEITDDMSSEEKLKLLKSRYPEFEPLAKDFVDLQPEYKNILAEAQKAEEAMTGSETSVSVPILKFRALASYLGSISMYFTLLTSPAEDGDGKSVALSPAELRDHPIVGSLVKCRKQWETVKDWSIPEASNIEEDVEAEVSGEDVDIEPVVQQSLKDKKSSKATRKEKKTSTSQQAAEKARAEAEARRAEKIKKAEANLADLADLVKTSSKKSKSLSKTTVAQAQEDDDSDLGDEGALTTREAEEKARKKRSLRFYTSQIAQKANKRNAAGRNAGGDEDLPYRERLKDRQARLNAEAERRGRAQANEAEQLGGDSDEEDHRLAREVRGDAAGTDDDEYYDMVAARNKQKKAEKKARAEQAEAAQKEGYYEEVEEIGPDGKRRITYQIEKNKGLAAKRNKDVRNPRVKKRKKFEQKKKKLASIRQVYKGGEGRGGYGGELTGIKKNLVKSVKL
ncbi:Sas10/Utp3 family protein [Talaromyces stipitatus ATCC 10500]|uniref:Sas10/Utp3 family protein n=1 Tax=Talaromyces stipitatus (strain ATCC 10500 / CBS 375.48 / QM 6759 / NRRL 1006) TaxID=441959 RepID=B8LVQ5_TALSN|nr:Sas10/Utp3 family protein [Talaromyces stipitatus ATCC 10500]EED24185.1 Sas10/Utp3 family protein [Talaromyces stipitatus ATCC 10500]